MENKERKREGACRRANGEPPEPMTRGGWRGRRGGREKIEGEERKEERREGGERVR
jgi:hypothetical protein